MSLLTDGFEKCGIPSAAFQELAGKMESYINEIILFNSAYNLTNTSNHDELVIRHILDSLAAYPLLDSLINNLNSKDLLIGDIGSGGGLPGIPLAAAFPDYKFNLVERMSKRCAFLENCSAILGLKNVEVVCSEAEKVPPQKYDLITFRAFRPLDEAMTKTLLKMVKSGGYLCAYKAKMESITEEMQGIKVEPELDIQIDLNVTSYIPDEYISNQSQKIEVYQDIALCKTEDDIQNIIDEIIDRYGDMPTEIENLIKIAQIKSLCKANYIEKVYSKQDKVVFSFGKSGIDLDLPELLKKYRNKIKFSAGVKPSVTLLTKATTDEQLLNEVKDFLESL